PIEEGLEIKPQSVNRKLKYKEGTYHPYGDEVRVFNGAANEACSHWRLHTRSTLVPWHKSHNHSKRPAHHA
mgnify:CR=1